MMRLERKLGGKKAMLVCVSGEIFSGTKQKRREGEGGVFTLFHIQNWRNEKGLASRERGNWVPKNKRERNEGKMGFNVIWRFSFSLFRCFFLISIRI